MFLYDSDDGSLLYVCRVLNGKAGRQQQVVPGGCLGGGDGMVCVCECDNSKTGREDSMMQTWSCVG